MKISQLSSMWIAALSMLSMTSAFAVESGLKKEVVSPQSKASIPCLIGNVEIGEKLFEINQKSAPFIPYRFLGIPVLGKVTFQIEADPTEFNEAFGQFSTKETIANKLSYTDKQLSGLIHGNAIFESALFINPWAMVYGSLMGGKEKIDLHNYVFILGNLPNLPAHLVAGKFHIPFGVNATEHFDGGLAGGLGCGANTLATSLNSMPWHFYSHYSLKAKMFAFLPTEIAEDKVTANVGFNLQHDFNQDDVNITSGASYVTRLAKSNTDVEGFNAYAHVDIKPGKLKVEYIRGINFLNKYWDDKGKGKNNDNMPYVWTVEGSLHLPTWMNKDTVIVGGYSWGEDNAKNSTLDAGSRIFGGVKWEMSKRVTLGLGVMHDMDVPNAKASKEKEGIEKKSTTPKDDTSTRVKLQLTFSA